MNRPRHERGKPREDTRPASEGRPGEPAPLPLTSGSDLPGEPEGPSRRAVLTRRLRLLVLATISYNVIEAVVAVTSGIAASSAALLGFGLDSVIEVASAAAVAWQFSAREASTRRARERGALRVIAISFFALAAYVTVTAVRTLLGDTEPAASPVGIGLAALSLLVMPALSLTQRRTGRLLGSASAIADSKQTLLCSYLSAVLLVGLLLNASLGWFWADPAAALVIAVMAVKEGREAWRGDGCCAQGGLATAFSSDSAPACCGPGHDCCDE
ncbi:Cation efflux family protein [Actinopolyspora alba]|uniref:Cation efflux family protein n=1 Tax=Actinopolyspora alba TaxID=673379 RepID=A0A1I1VI82_9ACTN|nr:cation transporter [Actinopolyspora alba]SFD80180.1 Cation efflux family protein [Actinopolyspora alba]